ncbi:hypothetical protein SAMN05428973_1011331 [Duganella sp. OV510]|nr:hypothetical protein SAMN05428973_1011331 [Duganella sp. OV510]
MSITQSKEQLGKSSSQKVLETGGKLYDTRHSSH